MSPHADETSLPGDDGVLIPPPRPFRGVRALFVAWQHPRTRAYHCVARLVEGLRPRGFGGGHTHEDRSYEFAYTRGTVELDHFEPFPAYPRIDKVYRSDDLPPFFANRVMSSKRLDYPAHVARLKLDPATASPFDLLVRTGGLRATDAVELFGRPQLTLAQDRQRVSYETWFFAHGFSHLPEEQQEAALRLASGSELACVPEPLNPKDPEAVALAAPGGAEVGYVPRYLAPDAGRLQEACEFVRVVVEQVNPAPAPTSQRLLCRMNAEVPVSFRPFDGPAFAPRSVGAVELETPYAVLEPA